MIKSKLMAIFAGITSVAVVAATSLTLVISGPRTTMSLHTLSDNEAVAHGITNLLGTTTSGLSTFGEVIDVMSTNKAQLSVGFNFNEIPDVEKLSGLGATLDIQSDGDTGQYLITGDLLLQSLSILSASLYADDKELIASAPALFEGIITVPTDNLIEDIKNSYFGPLLDMADIDLDEYDEYLNSLEELLSNSAATMPSVDFDYEEFYEGLFDTINDSYYKAAESIVVEDNGKQPLTGGSYQCYTANLPVKEFSYILKDAMLYILKNEDFLSYYEDIMNSMNSMVSDDIYDSYDYDDYDDYDDLMNMYDVDISSQLSGAASMIDSYWGMVVSALETVLGDSIQMTLYLTDTVEMAGFEFYMSSMDDNGTFNFSKEAAMNADEVIIVTGDYTGGKELGDYTYISFEAKEYGAQIGAIEYSYKMEADGNFTLDISFSEDGYSKGILHMNGSYTEDNEFFDLDVDSFKVVDSYGNTAFDVSFSISFKPIDKVTKPTGTPEYNIWTIDSTELEALITEIGENFSFLNIDFN